MKKRIDTSEFVNELRGASLYFQRQDEKPIPPEPSPLPDTNEKLKQVAKKAKANKRTPPTPRTGRTDPSSSTDRTPSRRRVRRWAYEIYEDQVDALRILAGKAMMQGDSGSASAMVREALDEFIARKNREG